MESPDIFFWSSTSRNTERFVERIARDGRVASRIGTSRDLQTAMRPFVLVMPTYAGHDGTGAVPKPVIRFLNAPENRRLLTGVIGGGNRNFGSLFAYGARIVSQKCDVPLLHRFELAGTDEDVRIVTSGLADFLPLATRPALHFEA